MPAKRKRTNTLGMYALADVERRLPLVKADSVAAAALAERVYRWVSDDPDISASDGKSHDYHKAGVGLWNKVVLLERDPAPTVEFRRLLVYCGVLAMFVVNHAFAEGMHPGLGCKKDSIYLLHNAVCAANACVALSCGNPGTGSDVELGRLALDLAAKHQQSLNNLLKDGSMAKDQDGDDFTRLKAKSQEYNARRAAAEMFLLYKEGRLKDADKMFCEHLENATGLDPDTLTWTAAALCSIGISLNSSQDYEGAVTWLERAVSYSPVDNAKGKNKSRDALDSKKMKSKTDLQMRCMMELASAALHLGTPRGYERAQELMKMLVSLPGGASNIRVQHLQLALYDSPLAESFDASSYADVLLKAAQSCSSEKEFRYLHHHIQKLHSKSPGLGCEVLDEWMFLMRDQDRAGTGLNSESMEKLVIARVWLLAHQRETEEDLDIAQAVLSKLGIPISASAAAAAQTELTRQLMWKRIEQGYQEKQYATAMRWCQFALSPVFEAAGRANRPLIERKLILCADEIGDLEAAKSAYASMSKTARDEPMTKYLMYKLAIKLGDRDMAAECLRCIGMSADKKELLHACVLHARHAKQPQFVVQALKKLADSINSGHGYDVGEGAPEQSPVHTPALFRCTVLMLRDIIDEAPIDGKDGDQNNENDAKLGSGNGSNADDTKLAICDLLDVFQGTIDAAELERDCPVPDRGRLFTTKELDWFHRAAYNIGLKHAGKWDLRHTVAILNACVKTGTLFLSDGQPSSEVKSYRLSSRFLIASALAALTRSASASLSTWASLSAPEDAMQEQMLTDCQAMRKHILAFHAELREMSGTGSESDLLHASHKKLAVLLAFDFEGAIRLGDWDELEMICEKVASCDNPDTLRVIGDTLLRAQATVPSKVFVSTMWLIVGKLHETSNFSNEQLIKYYRCLFQAALYRDNDAAFQVLEEVGRLVRSDASDSPDLGDSQAPAHDSWSEELQYMATVAFNEGVDWFAGGSEEQSRQWVAAAMRLAELSSDNGQLKSTMSSRLSMLGMGDLGVQMSVEAEEHDGTRGAVSAEASSPAAEMATK